MLQTLPLYQKQTISFQDTQVLFNGFFLAVTQNLVTCSTSLSQLATLQTLLYVFTFLPLNVFFYIFSGIFLYAFSILKRRDFKHVTSNKKTDCHPLLSNESDSRERLSKKSFTNNFLISGFSCLLNASSTLK